MHFTEAKGILSAQNGMNLYRGCTHGCIYCDSRSSCYQMNHDFEDIEVKQNAPELLEMSLKSKRKKCMIGTGSMCDPYMHCEKSLGLTRKCIELIDEYGFGLAIQTKSDLILRDMDLLERIHKKTKCVVQMTLTTVDEDICSIIEPNVCGTHRRYEVLKTCQSKGIPTVVWIDPILPWINDNKENIRGILDYCVDAGVKGIICFSMGLTLREGNREYFYSKLDRFYPGLREKYQHRYGTSYEVISEHNRELVGMVTGTCKKIGIMCRPDEVFSYLHEFQEKNSYEQMSLLDL